MDRPDITAWWRAVVVTLAMACACQPAPSLAATREGAGSPQLRVTAPWPEYDGLTQRIAQLSNELGEKNREMVRRYGRNDTPEALAVLTPLRESLRAAQHEQRRLLECEKEPVRDPAAMFRTLGIKTSAPFGIPDNELLSGYIESRVMDGTITEQQKARFWRIVSLRTSGVMNPGSRGASSVVRAVSGTMSCFGIDTPPRPDQGPKAGIVSVDPMALAKKYASDQRIDFYAYHMNRIGNVDGYFAPIVITRERHILLVGTKSGTPPGGTYEKGKSRPIVSKLDPAGKLLWQRSLPKSGFMDYEGGSLAQTADGGYVVFILSYVDPSLGASTRLVKLDASGNTVWDHHFRGRGTVDTPFAETVRLLPSGSVSLMGHVYPTAQDYSREIAYRWSAEVDPNGTVVYDKTGPAGKP
ncbi:MAG TPA: hypothetical protein VFR01_03535 [Geobacterales bacterium]|nr:hypothetical protein [Geobacterales bacterium]